MSEFQAMSVCILGRQPALGLAELESLYGAGHVQPFGQHVLLDVAAEEINFKMLGGTIKTARILSELPYHDFRNLSKYLIEEVPRHLHTLPEGKFTIGLSAYGLKTSEASINRTALELKRTIKKNRPIRVVPNKAPALSSAQVLHNKLTHQGAWELLLVSNGQKTFVAQTLFVQDIEAYSARDQARPMRDARVGMLPPKLAQIIINLAMGMPNPKKIKGWDKADGFSNYLVLDPFCGSGVILQEALLMGYSVYGSDKDQRMVEYAKQNLRWLIDRHPEIQGRVVVEPADATAYIWPGFSVVASELYLGPPLVKPPEGTKLRQIVSDVNGLVEKFLKNLATQSATKGRKICLAVPVWRGADGRLVHLPIIDRLTDMGYTYLDLKHVRREQLIYYRENQVVARQLLRLKKV